MNKKLVYSLLGIGVFIILSLIFGEKFAINGLVGGFWALVMWLVVGSPGLGKKKSGVETDLQKKL